MIFYHFQHIQQLYINHSVSGCKFINKQIYLVFIIKQQKLLLFQYKIQYQRAEPIPMKLIGSIKNSKTQTVGKLYQTQNIQKQIEFEKTQRFNYQIRDDNYSSKKDSTKRVNSVGKIYNRNHKLQQNVYKSPMIDQKKFQYIDYDIVQNKMAQIFEKTIKSSVKLKYDYPSDQSAYDNIIGQALVKKMQNKQTSEKALRNKQMNKAENKKQGKLQRKYSNQAINNTKGIISSRKDKQNLNPSKKDALFEISNINHKEHKSELENKLKKIIDNYEGRNKQLSLQFNNINQPVNKINQQQAPQALKQQNTKILFEVIEKVETLAEVFDNLVSFSFKQVNFNQIVEQKLDNFWKSIHNQIILDEKVRVIKYFINKSNFQSVFMMINNNKLKKIQENALSCIPQEYDPFLVQKFEEYIKEKKIDLTTKNNCRWIAELFVQKYEQSQKHWIKYLSHEKVECFIRTSYADRQLKSIRKKENFQNELNLKDLTRWLSILFKSNLRNRNVYQIFSKIKNFTCISRFIDLLEERISQRNDTKKSQQISNKQ